MNQYLKKSQELELRIKEVNMRLIDADELKDKLLKMQDNIIDKEVQKGSSISDAWKAAYLLVFDEYIKILDEMPRTTHHYVCNHDCDALYKAYAKGYSKGYIEGKEGTLREEWLKKDLYKHDYNALNKIQKEQKMENSEMTRDELWSKVIQNLKIFDQEAHDEEFVPLITSLLVIEAEELRTNVTNGTIAQEDKSHIWSLVDELGCFSIKGEAIMYLPGYQELTTLLRKVF